jgi:uncharacterized glyoxalase superfamily protein PhnB
MLIVIDRLCTSPVVNEEAHGHSNCICNTKALRESNGTTCIIGLFVPDVHAVMSNAIQAGAKEISHAKDYEYGYHQGEIEYPFGHHWLIQRKIL